MDLSFALHKLEKFSSNPGKVNFGGLVHLSRYIGDNKNSSLKYYADMNYAPVSYLLRQASIKTENNLMNFSDSGCQDCSDTGRGTVGSIQGTGLVAEEYIPKNCRLRTAQNIIKIMILF